MDLQSGPSPEAHYDQLRRAVADALAIDPAQWRFRSDSRYTAYLDHNNADQAEQILQAISEQFSDIEPNILERLPRVIAQNDAFGDPKLSFIPSLQLTCCASNIRYLWHALIFLRHLKHNNMHQPTVVEIGAGYGATALYICRFSDLFDIQISTYITIDLEEAAKLQQIYADYLSLPLKAVYGLDEAHLTQVMQTPGQKALFSAYAFSEFIEPIQRWYVQHVLDHCKHGFIVWNSYNDWSHRGPNPIYKFMDKDYDVMSDVMPSYPGWDMSDVTW